jgi:hypothetical protein
MATHILHDPVIKDSHNPCGFCCAPGDACMVHQTKDKGHNGSRQIDVNCSQCVNGNVVKISLKSASTSTTTAPCTNIPIDCPLCPVGSAAVWKYNFVVHLK